MRAAAADALKPFQEQYRAVDHDDGQPIAGQAYRIEMADGTIYAGKANAEELTRRVSTDHPEQVKLVWIHDEDEMTPAADDAWEGC